ncbi:MAG: hypothetical protein OXU22_09030 [Gammaproteobacteria bacterium]|nr:hypothetical protein [Gammaproteobacteria bacterium]
MAATPGVSMAETETAMSCASAMSSSGPAVSVMTAFWSPPGAMVSG